MGILFSKTTSLENEIDNFLDKIAKSGLVFKAGVKNYLDEKSDDFQERLKEIDDLESGADTLRRSIRTKLYTKLLIPESRGDVLSLLENMDNVIDATKEVLTQFDVEKPVINDSFKEDFNELAVASVEALDFVVKANRAFFKEISMINDYINKVHFYEHEADKFEDKIKREVFTSSEVKDLAQKMHIRDFAVHIARISDEAEAVCEKLSVFAIKRTV